VVVCLERGADCLHMVQLMPLHPRSLSSLASFKSRLVSHFTDKEMVRHGAILLECGSAPLSEDEDGKTKESRRPRH